MKLRECPDDFVTRKVQCFVFYIVTETVRQRWSPWSVRMHGRTRAVIRWWAGDTLARAILNSTVSVFFHFLFDGAPIKQEIAHRQAESVWQTHYHAVLQFRRLSPSQLAPARSRRQGAIVVDATSGRHINGVSRQAPARQWPVDWRLVAIAHIRWRRRIWFCELTNAISNGICHNAPPLCYHLNGFVIDHQHWSIVSQEPAPFLTPPQAIILRSVASCHRGSHL